MAGPRIVAELGRPETPQETADRKAASSARYRSSKTFRNLVAALLITIAVVAVVYLAGATLGQAAPTPGGLGAVEAALAAGLTAGGLDGGIAVSAVLLFRLLTFWIPTIPGYWSFNWLTRKGLL